MLVGYISGELELYLLESFPFALRVTRGWGLGSSIEQCLLLEGEREAVVLTSQNGGFLVRLNGSRGP